MRVCLFAHMVYSVPRSERYRVLDGYVRDEF